MYFNYTRYSLFIIGIFFSVSAFSQVIDVTDRETGNPLLIGLGDIKYVINDVDTQAVLVNYDRRRVYKVSTHIDSIKSRSNSLLVEFTDKNDGRTKLISKTFVEEVREQSNREAIILVKDLPFAFKADELYDDIIDDFISIPSGGGGGGSGGDPVISSASSVDPNFIWRETPENFIRFNLGGSWAKFAPDRQFLTTADLRSNVNDIPWRIGEVIQVNSVFNSDVPVRYEVVSSTELATGYHVADTTYFLLSDGISAVLKEEHNGGYLSPEMVGAVGDGVADDSRALTIAHYYSLNVKYGFQKTYRTTISIPILPDQVIDMNESVIRQERNYLYPAFDAPLAHRAHIKNGTIWGVDTLISPELLTGNPDIWRTIDNRPKIGDVYHQTGILCQDADSIVIENMGIHNYRQGIMVLNMKWFGPNSSSINPWDRPTDPEWTDVANWNSNNSNMSVYVYDSDLSWNLFGLLGGGCKLIYLDGIIGNVLPPDTLPVTIYAFPHLVYTSSGDNQNIYPLQRFVGKNIRGLPSPAVQDVSILKLTGVIDSYVENLFVDSIETALEFYGGNLIARNIHGTQMYGGFLRLQEAAPNIISQDSVIRVIENVSAEFVNIPDIAFNYGIEITGDNYTIKDVNLKWADHGETRTGGGDGISSFSPIDIKGGNNNRIDGVNVDFSTHSEPLGWAIEFSDTSSNNIITNVSCVKCDHIVANPVGAGSGNYVRYNINDSDFEPLTSYNSVEQRVWDQDEIYLDVIGGEQQGVIVGNFAKFNPTRGLTLIVDEAKAPEFATNGLGGPDYPIFVKVVNSGGAIPINVNGYMGIASTEGDFEFPPHMPGNGESITYRYQYDQSTQKFYLLDTPEFSYKENPYGNENNVSSILDDLYSDVSSQPDLTPYLLDSYTLSEYDHAYALERINRNYAGSLIRVKRLSDNIQQDIGYDSNNKLDTASIVSFCGGSTCEVTILYDQVGNLDFDESTGRGEPEIYDGTKIWKDADGNPYLRFDPTELDALDMTGLTSTSRYVTRFTLRELNPISAGGFDVVLYAVGATQNDLLRVTPNPTPNFLYENTYDGFSAVPSYIGDTFYGNNGTFIDSSFYATYFNAGTSTSMTGITIGCEPSGSGGQASALNFQVLFIDDESSGSAMADVEIDAKAVENHYTQDYSNYYWKQSDGKTYTWSDFVGIGTGVPTASLDVSGDARIRSTSRRDTLNKIAVFDDDGNLDHKLITSGVVTDTTDGSGDIVVAHSFGATPTIIDINTQGGGPLIPDITVIDGTNFTVRFYDTSGAAVTSTSITFSWSAQ
jgi:hypothetical protein